MEYDASRLAVLSGLGNPKPKMINESVQKCTLKENALRKMIREEIQAYLSIKDVKDEKHTENGLHDLNLTSAMGYLNVTPPYAQKKSNRSYARGPGRSFAFGGPGFM